MKPIRVGGCSRVAKPPIRTRLLMAKKPLARRWKVGQVYRLEGGTGERDIRLIGRGKIGPAGQEVLFFRPVRKAKKTRP